MARYSNRVELLMLMDAAGLIKVPEGINGFARKQLEMRGLEDKAKLREVLTDHKYGKCKLLYEPSIGEVTVAEMCWWAVYGNDEPSN